MTGGNPDRELASIIGSLEAARDDLLETTRTLVRLPSQTPPSDTRAMARAVADMLTGIPHIDTRVITSEPPIDNLVATVRATRPGRRLVLNGHLDTYPAGDPALWSHDPCSGHIADGRLYGRGSADMKGGIACLLKAFTTLAAQRDRWAGEVSLVLAGDEESMGRLGTQFLLDTIPEARGDAAIIADVGSPLVARIGEKGMIWIDVFATGQSAHGAHVHRGRNAIDALRRAMDALSTLADHPVRTPDDVAATIARAKPISEPLGGAGEAGVMQQITVNFGRISGGISPNLVPDRAELNADIRLPMGVSVAEVEARIAELLNPVAGISYEITRRYEPTWTPSDDPIVAAVLSACSHVLQQEPVANMRVGASDARLYRAAGIATVVCGLTPYNLGGPDEYLDIAELVPLTKIHTMSALSYLARH